MKKIEFVEVNVEEDEAAYLFLEREGYKTLPQIYKGMELFVANGHLGLLRMMREGKL